MRNLMNCVRCKIRRAMYWPGFGPHNLCEQCHRDDQEDLTKAFARVMRK